MRRILMIWLTSLVIAGGVSQGMDEEPGQPKPVAAEASTDRPPITILIPTLITDDDGGKREVISRPTIRTVSGQPARIEVCRDNNRAVVVVELLATAEVESSESLAADRQPSNRENFQTATSVAGMPIHITLSVSEMRNKKSTVRMKTQLTTHCGERTSFRIGGLEIQLTPVVRAEETPNERDEAVDSDELRLLCALQKRLSVEMVDVPLAEAIKELGKRVKANVYIDPRAIEDEGLTLQTKVTAAAHGLRLSTVLDRILSPLGLDYIVADEVIKITSRTRARGEPVTVTYAVDDLIARPDNGRVVPDPDAEQNLIEQIAETLSPETWDRKGGRGSIRVFQATHSLVVRQVADVHDEIAELLSRLRTARRQAAAAATTEDRPAAVENPADQPEAAPESTRSGDTP